MSARMESKSNNSSCINRTNNNNNSNKGGQSDIEYFITNPQEPWATKVQVEDEGEVLVVNPKFSAALGAEVITPTSDREFLLSNDQVLETLAKSGVSQAGWFEIGVNPNSGEPIDGVPERGCVTQVPSPYEDWGWWWWTWTRRRTS